jgi:hypothetical protein
LTLRSKVPSSTLGHNPFETSTDKEVAERSKYSNIGLSTCSVGMVPTNQHFGTNPAFARLSSTPAHLEEFQNILCLYSAIQPSPDIGELLLASTASAISWNKWRSDPPLLVVVNNK